MIRKERRRRMIRASHFQQELGVPREEGITTFLGRDIGCTLALSLRESSGRECSRLNSASSP
jgi:hypothetical protein